jgi:hypothetical protein
MDDIEYLQRRERQERAAAKRAASLAARAAHQELAQIYAALIVAVRRQRRLTDPMLQRGLMPALTKQGADHLLNQ